MRHPGCARFIVVAMFFAVAAAIGCGQSWTRVAELRGSTDASGTTSHTADFQVDGSIRVTYHISSGSGTIVAYLMPSGATDDLEGRVDSGQLLAIGNDDGQSVTIDDLHGSYYVTATGMFEPWSLEIETAQ